MIRRTCPLIPSILVLLAILSTVGWQVLPARAEAPPDYDIPNGHFFTQTNGSPTGADFVGYAVTDDSVPFWSEWRRLGGLATLGYPISRRFAWNGFSVQAFQKGVLQWRPEVGQAWLVNVFDMLHDAGKDAWLKDLRSTPPPLPASFDSGKSPTVVMGDRQAILDAYPAIKARYFANPDPLAFYGLPTSQVADNGNHFAVRLQRAVIQQWKVDVPWAKAGQVTVANGGEIAKEAGLLPIDALATDLPPWGAGHVVVIDPGHGGAEIGTAYRFVDGVVMLEKDLNLRVALKVADLLGRAGYKVVLTRKTDTEVNKPPKPVTGHPPIGLDDELQTRIDIANNARAELFLSIHFNGHADSKMSGPEVYYCKDRPFAADSRHFAELLLTNLTQGLAGIGYPNPDGVVKDDSQAVGSGQHFYLLGPANGLIVRPSQMPAALAEGLFVTNTADATTLRGERTLDVIARAYATAVHQYFVKNTKALLPAPPTVSPTPSSKPAVPPVAATPTPQPTPKPSVSAPTLGTGVVATEYGGGALLRAKPATSSEVVRSVPNGESVDLLQAVSGEAVVANDTGWYRARYDGTEGFVYGQLVRAAQNGSLSSAPSSPVLGKGTISTEFGGGAMLRVKPATSSEIVRSVPNGESVDLLQAVSGEAVVANDTRWYRASYDGTEGFLYAQLVQSAQNGPTISAPSPLGKGTISTEFGGGAFLRSKPATTGDVVRALPDGATIDLLQAVTGEAVLEGDSRWYRARYDGSEGYICGSLIKLN